MNNELKRAMISHENSEVIFRKTVSPG